MMTTILTSIPWPDVVAVGIRTTADGPFATDVFWEFLIRERGAEAGGRCIEIPGDLVDSSALDELYTRLPGVDSQKITRAMSSTSDCVFRIWHRKDSPFLPDASALAARFCALVARLGGDARVARGVFDHLIAAWSSPSRRYHSVEHLIDCLRELDTVKSEAMDTDVVELALWYHDAVYRPTAHDNEARSADMLLADALTLRLRAESANVAADLVRATMHTSEPTTVDARLVDLVLDIDLSILGRDVLRFMDYEYAVEDEYAQTSTTAFRVGRGRFLTALLARPRIFRTDSFHARYESAARSQVATLLAGPRYRSYRWLGWLPLRRRERPARDTFSECATNAP